MSKKSTTAKQVIQYYWSCVRKYPYSLIGLLFAVPITVLFNQFVPPLILARVLRELSQNHFIAGHPWQSFSHDIILYAVISLVSSLALWRLVDLIDWKLEAKVQYDIANQVFHSLTTQGADFHANRFSGSLVSQNSKLLGSYVRIMDTSVFSTLPLLSSIVIASVILHKRAPLFVACLAIFSLIYIITAFFVTRGVRKTSERYAEASNKETGYLADTITNVMAVKSFSAEQFEADEFEKVSAVTRGGLVDILHAHQKQMAYFGGFAGTISSVSFAVAIISVVTYKADVSTVFLILNFTASVVNQLFSFSNNAIKNYNRAIGDASDMVNVIALEQEVKDPAEPEHIRMNRGEIRFNDVSFRHKEASSQIFEHLDLKIKPGEKVGLIGHSGAGKTSLTRILLRFSDVNSGNITIDGQDISKVTQADLRSAISYVPQEPLLFHRTISENIRYGRPDASMREVEAIARQANSHEFITTLAKGYDTLVGERGVKLSGGQRQRIAIARAMIKNAPILVLDEATSALDSESEALIQDALWKLMEGRTAIVIAHRLSTIQRMDRIIVMEAGKIVEEGSHRDLLYKKGVYASLWNRQSGGFIEE